MLKTTTAGLQGPLGRCGPRRPPSMERLKSTADGESRERQSCTKDTEFEKEKKLFA